MSQKVRDYFYDITTIPRPSGQEERIRQWLIDWADARSLEHQTDAVGNLVIYVPASADLQDKPTIILQAHMDMVCVQGPDSVHNFSSDPLQLREQDDRLCATDTTLGADNGIAIGMMLAIVDETHPALELLFTIDEERGLTGALQLDTSLLSGEYLINLDTEDEGEICISSAGGARVDCHYVSKSCPVKYASYRVDIQGLQGGHSGVDIHRKRGNAIMAMLQLLHNYRGDLQLIQLQGGQADNAIPASCFAIISPADIDSFTQHMTSHCEQYQKIYDVPGLTCTITPVAQQQDALTEHVDMLRDIIAVALDVRQMHHTIPDLVHSSINLGICEINSQGIKLSYAPRSSDNGTLDQIIDQLHQHYAPNGRQVTTRSCYPGRSQNPEDALVQNVKRHYDSFLPSPSKIVAYHAGLECGAIVGKLGAHVQSVSFGPTIKDPHSPQERVYKPSVDRVYQVLHKLLHNRDI